MAAARSIATRRGDDGTTELLFGRRVPKHSLRVEAYGTVDELGAALGLARAHLRDESLRAAVAAVQRTLLTLGGQLAVDPADQERFDKHPKLQPLTAEDLKALDDQIATWESAGVRFAGFVLPGEAPEEAALHVARAVCRRAERAVARLAAEEAVDPLPGRYLNRLADWLWLVAAQVMTSGESD